jgi:hypothetical protein
METYCVLRSVRGEENLINFLIVKAYCHAALRLRRTTLKYIIQNSLFYYLGLPELVAFEDHHNEEKCACCLHFLPVCVLLY